MDARFGPYQRLAPKVAYVSLFLLSVVFLTHVDLFLRSIVSDLISREHQRLMNQLGRLLRYETSPFTQNEHYLSASKREFIVRAKEARAKFQAGHGPVGAVPTAAPKVATPHVSVLPASTDSDRWSESLVYRK